MNRRTRHLYALTIAKNLPIVHEFSTKEERNSFLELHPDAKRLTSVEAASYSCHKMPEELKQDICEFIAEIKRKTKKARKKKIKAVKAEVTFRSCLAEGDEEIFLYVGNPKFLPSVLLQKKIKSEIIKAFQAEKRSPDFYGLVCTFYAENGDCVYGASRDISADVFIK